MKTSNLITDFLIIGIICVISITMPYFIIYPDKLKSIINIKFENPTLLIALFTIVTYILGILFYQFSDYGIKFLSRVLVIKEIQNTKKDIEEKLGMGYHNALQMVVIKSKNSFDYLSYRRTIIRVIRAILFSSFLFVFLHLIYSLILCICGEKLIFSKINTLVIIVVIGLNIFTRFVYIKQYTGYFNAIVIFNKLLNIDSEEIKN